MSTKLEDLPDDDHDQEDYEDHEQEDHDQEDYEDHDQEDFEDDHSEHQVFLPTPEYVEGFWSKLRDPIIVILLMMIGGNPILTKGLKRISVIENVSDWLLHLIMSVVVGVLFFVIREFL